MSLVVQVGEHVGCCRNLGLIFTQALQRLCLTGLLILRCWTLLSSFHNIVWVPQSTWTAVLGLCPKAHLLHHCLCCLLACRTPCCSLRSPWSGSSPGTSTTDLGGAGNRQPGSLGSTVDMSRWRGQQLETAVNHHHSSRVCSCGTKTVVLSIVIVMLD